MISVLSFLQAQGQVLLAFLIPLVKIVEIGVTQDAVLSQGDLEDLIVLS